jgi:hypothetical protein
MLTIQRSIMDLKRVTALGRVDILAPARTFVREGTFEKINHYGKGQLRHFFLFSDEIVYCKPAFLNTKNQFKGRVPLDKCRIKFSESKNS